MVDSPKKKQTDGHVYRLYNTGVDPLGPVEVTVLRRPLKYWRCLYSVLVTRAVHIEVDNGTDIDLCKVATTMFMARGGKPHARDSDNDTNFVGATREVEK